MRAERRPGARGAAALALCVVCLWLSRALAYEYDQWAESEAFAAFKENAVETGCVLERFGPFAAYGHTRVGAEGGTELTDEEAREAYDCARGELRRAYAGAGDRQGAEYQDWQMFSTQPYGARAHSHRYVSNYANAVAARRYGRYERVGRMPVGSVLAKDSFVVNDLGRVLVGALALMEKMPPGFNPESGDWRFSMILPDGRLMGRTGGPDEFAVRFCQDCHRDAGSGQDYLFFMPLRYRAGAGSGG